MPGMPPPPTTIFKVPKIKPGSDNFKLKSTNSMSPTVQAAQPSQWDLASPGLPPMKTGSAYEFGQHTALEKLGMTKGAAPVGMLGGVSRLYRHARLGWGGRGFAAKPGISGAAGALHGSQQYMRNLMRAQPGTAAGMIGLGAAGATGAAALGANTMFGGQNNAQQPITINNQ